MAPGLYREAVEVNVPNITIRGDPGAHVTGEALNGKGAFVVRAKNVTIEGIECSGISVRDGNGACIRLEAPSLTVRNVYFHDNENISWVDDPVVPS